MKDAKQQLQQAMLLLDNIEIPYGPIVGITVNSRAKSRWGRCTKVCGGYRIEITDRLLQDDVSYEATMDTLVHELLHAYPNRMCHTGEWKRCAELVNDCYAFLNIKRCTSAAEKDIEEEPRIKRYKYIITCQDCDREYKYQRRSAVIKAIEQDPYNHGCRCCCGSKNLRLEWA